VAIYWDNITIVVALVCQNQKVRMGIQMKAVTVRVHDRLHNWSKWNQRPLVKNSFGYFKRIRCLDLLNVWIQLKLLLSLFVLACLELF